MGVNSYGSSEGGTLYSCQWPLTSNDKNMNCLYRQMWTVNDRKEKQKDREFSFI